MSGHSPAMPKIYFDTRTESYWLETNPGRFLNLSGRNVKLHLQLRGIFTGERDIGSMAEGDRILIKAQIDRYVDYAGPLAGNSVGVIETSSGKRLLITEQIKPILPGPKPSFPKLDLFLGQLLGGEQAHFFLCWLKIARESLLAGDMRPGQMLCLFGESGCGKSLLQALVTEVLGGRMAKPYQYMTGGTAFNEDLCSCEHWCIEDETSNFSIQARRAFGTAIKQATVNPLTRLHGKGKMAIAVNIFKRITLSANNESENMMILPPLDDSILDKLMLFWCGYAEVSGNRKKDWRDLTGELPGLVRFLDDMTIPAGMRCPLHRYGVRAYQHREVLDILASVSPEERLASIIDEVIFNKPDRVDPEEFRAEELELRLRNSPMCFAVDRLGTFPTWCGVYLSRLAKKFPDRFSSRRSNGRTIWTIKQQKLEEK